MSNDNIITKQPMGSNKQRCYRCINNAIQSCKDCNYIFCAFHISTISNLCSMCLDKSMGRVNE